MIYEKKNSQSIYKETMKDISQSPYKYANDFCW